MGVRWSMSYVIASIPISEAVIVRDPKAQA